MVPLAGAIGVVKAIGATGMVGQVGQIVLGVLPEMGLIAFAARWLGVLVFPAVDEARPLLRLSPEKRAEGRLYVGLLGGLLALDILRGALVHPGGTQDAANSVISFPILTLAAIILFRLAQLFRLHAGNGPVGDEMAGFRDSLIGFMARVVMVIAIIAPVMAAIGFIAAVSAVVIPTIDSLGLLGLLVVVQRLVDDVYRWVRGIDEFEDDGLLPILIGFALSFLSLPVFALIWGARVADLAELWTQFSEGFSVGSTRIAPGTFVTFLFVFGLCYGVTRLVQGALRTTVLPKTRIDHGGQNAILAGTGYLGIVIASLVAVNSAGIDLSSLAIVAGALSLGIGFGLQNIVSNFVSGLILLIERPVSEGDWIEAGGVQGTVRSISVRSTRIETFDRADVIVPNSNLITGVVTNMTKYSRVGRLIIPVGVAYGTDTRRVDTILSEIAAAQPLVVMNPPPKVLFIGFGADSLNFEIRVILRDVNFVLDVKSEINHLIAARFAEEGIEIPFAQRDIWLRNPEALHPRAEAQVALPDVPPAPQPPEAEA